MTLSGVYIAFRLLLKEPQSVYKYLHLFLLMKFIDAKTIAIDRTLNPVDLFTLEFINLLEKHTSYVIVSGYVAILFGRNRSTEDIDVIIPPCTKEAFFSLHKDLLSHGYWCINVDDTEELYDLLLSKHSIRFAVKPSLSPNAEIKFAKDHYDSVALQHPLTIFIGGKQLKTSLLELQIAYKEEVLKSNKDLEDAEHIRKVADGHLNLALLNHYKKELREK